MKKKMKAIKFLSFCLVFSLAIFTSCSGPKKEETINKAIRMVEYTCPMHPQILEDHPGSCPICGMTLVKKSAQASEGAGISLNTVLLPVNSSVISNVNAITPRQETVKTEILASGYLDFDTRTFNNIASRFSGRIEKVYIKSAFGEIHRGQRIVDIYSPELVTAQQDLSYLIKNSTNENSLIYAAKQKLLLAGMTARQVEHVISTGKVFYSLPVYSAYDGHIHDVAHTLMPAALSNEASGLSTNLPLSIKEGMYVEKGQTLFNVVNPHMLWAIIKVNSDDVMDLKPGQPVALILPDIPGKQLSGKVDFIEPVYENGDKTTSIRVYLHNMNHVLKVNSLVDAKIQTGETKGIWIPKAALVDLGRVHMVWLKSGASYRAHQVTTGLIKDKTIQITKGLSTADSIASNAQYLTDSESFIKTYGNE